MSVFHIPDDCIAGPHSRYSHDWLQLPECLPNIRADDTHLEPGRAESLNCESRSPLRDFA